MAELFAKLIEIKGEISALIGDQPEKVFKPKKAKRKVKLLKAENNIDVKPEKVKRKWTRTGKTNSPGLSDYRPKKMYCKDCKAVFETTSPALDATCNYCGSAHVDYATRYGK